MNDKAPKTKANVNVLSLDGGGIRGLLPAMFLTAIETYTGKAISELFDIISGTSTGGLLALALVKPDQQDKSKPAFKAEELIGLYEKEGEKIFASSTFDGLLRLGGLTEEKYPAESLESLLAEYFADTPLADALADVLITSYDIKNRQPFYFKSRLARNLESFNFAMKDVARATSAAPTYFEPAQVSPVEDLNKEDPRKWYLVDGGIFANNPGLLAYAEANRGEHQKNICLCSIGTGQTSIALDYEDAKGWGAIQWVKPLIDIVFDGVSDSVDGILKRLLTYDHDYYRFQVLLQNVKEDMDNTDPENLQALKALAHKEIYPTTDEAGNPVLSEELREACDRLLVNKFYPLKAKDVGKACGVSAQKAAASIKNLGLSEDDQFSYEISKGDSVERWYALEIIEKVKASLT